MITAEQATEAVSDQPGNPTGIVSDGGDVWLVGMAGDIPINDTVVVVDKIDGVASRVRYTDDMEDWPIASDSLTAAGNAKQLRAPKGALGGIGGEWIDTPTAVLGDMLDQYGKPIGPTTIGRSGVTADDLDDNSPANALAGANPNYGADPDYRINCQKATAVYEMRRRGMDVEADGGQGPHRGLAGLPSYFGIKGTSKRADTQGIQPGDGKGMARAAAQSVSRFYPAPSRGAVSLTWEAGGGHIFNWEVDGLGDVHFIDAQDGRDVTYDMDFWNRVHPSSVTLQRLDDAMLKEGVLDAIDPGTLTDQPE